MLSGLFKRLVVLFCLFNIQPVFCNEFNHYKKVKEANSRLEYINIDWWKGFNDDFLIKYIVCAIQNNHNLKSIRYKLNELRQEKNVEISKEFPIVSVGASYLGIKIPRYALPYEGFRDNSFALPFIASWEIDLFGKRKNKIDMAREDYNSAVFQEKWASIALAAEIAGIYFNILNLNSQIEVQNKIIKNKQEKFKRIKRAYNAGVLNAVDFNKAGKEFEYEITLLNEYLKQKESFLYNFAFLMGESPIIAQDFQFNKIENISFKGKIPEFLNSNITFARPDVLEKEAALKKAKIDVTLARKQFLPDINIFGVLVFSTLTPNFGWKGAVANLLVGATENIFSGGKRIFELKKKKFIYQEMLEQYLEADLRALKEINDALFALKTDIKSYDSNLKNFYYEENNFIRVSNSFVKGASGKIDVLDNENNFLMEKSRTLNSKTQQFIDLISLYKAAGGNL